MGVVREGGAGGSGTGRRGWWEWCRREGYDQWEPHPPLVLSPARFRPPLYHGPDIRNGGRKRAGDKTNPFP